MDAALGRSDYQSYLRGFWSSKASTDAAWAEALKRGGRYQDVESAVYFCALEAIQNATKHAGPAARVTVTLERFGDDLEATIANDGLGFDASANGHGIGLVSMRDRIGAVGGALEVASAPGGGTIVRAHVPQCWPHGEPTAPMSKA